MSNNITLFILFVFFVWLLCGSIRYRRRKERAIKEYRKQRYLAQHAAALLADPELESSSSYDDDGENLDDADDSIIDGGGSYNRKPS